MYRFHMMASYRLRPELTALIACCFLITVMTPRFGAFSHRHQAGRVPHVHLLFPPSAHDDREDHDHRQATSVLPFGGAYAHSTASHEPPPSGNDENTQSHHDTWTSANFHWHFDNGALPPGVTVPIVVESLTQSLHLTHAPPLPVRSLTRFDLRSRAPPL